MEILSETEDGLGLEIFLEALDAIFTTIAGPLVAAERRLRVPGGMIEMDLAAA
jgi:hypothetical protein